MILHFYLRYSSSFGQRLFVTGNIELLGNDDIIKAVPLTYLNDQLWHGHIEIAGKDLYEPLCYKYILQGEHGEPLTEFGNDRIIDLAKIKASKIILFDTWNHAGAFENTFFTAPFMGVLLTNKSGKKRPEKSQ